MSNNGNALVQFDFGGMYTQGIAGVVASQVPEFLSIIAILAKALNKLQITCAKASIEFLVAARDAMITSGALSCAGNMLVAAFSVVTIGLMSKNIFDMNKFTDNLNRQLLPSQQALRGVDAQLTGARGAIVPAPAAPAAPAADAGAGVAPAAPDAIALRAVPAAPAAGAVPPAGLEAGIEDPVLLRQRDAHIREDARLNREAEPGKHKLNTQAQQYYSIVTIGNGLGNGLGQLGQQAFSGESATHTGKKEMEKTMSDTTSGAESKEWDTAGALIRNGDGIYAGAVAATQG